MKKLLFCLITLVSLSASADGLTEADTGTFVILNQRGDPVDMFYRLSIKNGKWLMEGKKPAGSWKDISWDPGCAYHASSKLEVAQYIAADWRAKNQISCIQNIAQAFCRYTANKTSSLAQYVVIAFVTGKPTPLAIRRASL